MVMDFPRLAATCSITFESGGAGAGAAGGAVETAAAWTGGKSTGFGDAASRFHIWESSEAVVVPDVLY
jgi:hypothetical protein